MRAAILTLACLALGHEQATAQSKPPAKAPSKTKQAPLTQPVPGYKHLTVEGFHLLVSQQVLENNDSKSYERKPLDVLEMELKIVSSIMTPAALGVLRRLLIWVDWDDSTSLRNAVAVYYGGHQLSMLKDGKHPLRANNITVLRMKRLTEEHQPKDDQGRCVLLHEIAHAVHHQLIGFDNEEIKAAYRQALERKLVEKAAYAATNEKEFFAEMTCAYLDRLNYYPHARQDLGKHDATTYKLMKSIWGGTKRKVATRPDPRVASEDYSLGISLNGVKLENAIVGRAVDSEDLKGKVVLCVYMSPQVPSAAAAFSKSQGWHDELGELGLAVIGFNVQKDTDKALRDALNAHEVRFPFFALAYLPGMQGKIILPHAVLFDDAGKCIFRGSPFTAETRMRIALGEAILKSIGSEELAEELAPAAKLLRAGSAPADVLKRLLVLSPKTDAGKEQSRMLMEKLVQPAKIRVAQAETLAKDDPLAAYLSLESLPLKFKGTAEARQASQLLAKLKNRKIVAAELNARPFLSAVRKLDAQLAAKQGAADPTNAAFRRANILTIQQMQTHLQRLQRDFPAAPATVVALRIGEKYGLTVP